MANEVTLAALIDLVTIWLTNNASEAELQGNLPGEVALPLVEALLLTDYATVPIAEAYDAMAIRFGAGGTGVLKPAVQTAAGQVIPDDIAPLDDEDGPARPRAFTKSQFKDMFVGMLRRSPGWDERRYSGETVEEFKLRTPPPTGRYDEEAYDDWEEALAGRDRGDPFYITHIGEIFADAYSAWQKQGGSTSFREGYEPMLNFLRYAGEVFIPVTGPAWTAEAYDAEIVAADIVARGQAQVAKSDYEAQAKKIRETAEAAREAAAAAAASEAEAAAAIAKELSDRTRIRQAMSDAGLIPGPSGDLTTDLEALRDAQNLEDAIYFDIQTGNDFFARGLGPKVDFDARVNTRVLEAYAATLATSFDGVPYISDKFFLAQSRAQLAALREIAITGTLTPEEEARWNYLAGAVSQITDVGVELSPDQEDAVAARANEIFKTYTVDAYLVPETPFMDFAMARATAMEELGLTTAIDTETTLREMSPQLEHFLSGYGPSGTPHRDFPGGRDLTGVGGDADGGTQGYQRVGGSEGLSVVAAAEEARATFRSESEILTDIATSIGLAEFTDEDLPFLQYLREKTPDLGEEYREAYDKFIRERQYAFDSQTTKAEASQKKIAGGLGVPTFDDPVYGSPGGAQAEYTAQLEGKGIRAPEPLIPVSFTDFTRSRRESLRGTFEEAQRREKTGAARDVGAAFGLRSR